MDLEKKGKVFLSGRMLERTHAGPEYPRQVKQSNDRVLKADEMKLSPNSVVSEIGSSDIDFKDEM